MNEPALLLHRPKPGTVDGLALFLQLCPQLEQFLLNVRVLDGQVPNAGEDR